ncbi:MAG TPA: SDR family NAD(P)-dependent oxidoreductase [Polyangiaceae bacterium]|nr:SDR family NAD(P)-dependent oxidoreductase [Polyangiaceae bacterium]
MTKPVCVVVGIGPKNGAAFARTFSRAGHALALVSRRTDLSRQLAHELGDASAYGCDVADPTSVAQTFDAIAAERGAPDVLIYNAGSGFWKTADELTPAEFEQSFRVNALGLLTCAQRVLPAMRQRGRGQIVVVGATASLRGRPKTAAFAAAKAAQRSLAQSLARQLAPEGIHVSLLIIDGSIDDAGATPDDADAKRLRPEAIAQEALHLTQQDRSAWTFELDLRPLKETW